MKFYLKDSAIFMKDTALALNGEPMPLIRDQQASIEVLRYIVDAMNEKWERDPQKLRTRPEPSPGGGKRLGGTSG